MVLAIRTDTSQAEIYLLDESGKVIKQKIWEAGRELSAQLLKEITKLVPKFNQLKSIVVYEGPGSFTGLRIGISVANALAYAQNLPITGASGEDWLSASSPSAHSFSQSVVPEYGAPPHITPPRK